MNNNLFKNQNIKTKINHLVATNIDGIPQALFNTVKITSTPSVICDTKFSGARVLSWVPMIEHSPMLRIEHKQ